MPLDQGKPKSRYPRPRWIRIVRWPFVLFQTFVMTNYASNAFSALYSLVQQHGFRSLNVRIISQRLLVTQLFAISPNTPWIGAVLLAALLILSGAAFLAAWDYKRERDAITIQKIAQQFQLEIDKLRQEIDAQCKKMRALEEQNETSSSAAKARVHSETDDQAL